MHLESAAARGNASAIKLLHGPECPEPLEYLLAWSRELSRSRTVGFHGVNGLTYQDIDAWARFSGRTPSPMEVEALFVLDAVSRAPNAKTDEEDADD